MVSKQSVVLTCVLCLPLGFYSAHSYKQIQPSLQLSNGELESLLIFRFPSFLFWSDKILQFCSCYLISIKF